MGSIPRYLPILRELGVHPGNVLQTALLLHPGRNRKERASKRQSHSTRLRTRPYLLKIARNSYKNAQNGSQQI
eukprot:2686104-Prymnesium_polylepis.1